jgi:Replication factor-A C terminal domain
MLNAKISDLSGSIYVQFPRELGDAIMGKSAREFRDFKEATADDTEAVRNYLQEYVLNKHHHILIKASTDQYSSARGDGEQRFKFYAVKVMPRNINEEDNLLLKRLSIFKN